MELYSTLWCSYSTQSWYQISWYKVKLKTKEKENKFWVFPSYRVWTKNELFENSIVYAFYRLSKRAPQRHKFVFLLKIKIRWEWGVDDQEIGLSESTNVVVLIIRCVASCNDGEIRIIHNLIGDTIQQVFLINN